MTLNRRIILSASLVLAIFITFTAVTLERAFIDSSESALRDKLTSQLYTLMAVAEIEDNMVMMPSDELDSLLGLPGSGIYAQITDQHGELLWQSSSTLGAKPPAPLSLDTGDKRFRKIDSGDDGYYGYSYGVDWVTDTDTQALTFNISTDLRSFKQQIKAYRNTLWGWLLAMALLLIASQALILRWGLSPLRKVGSELNRIESGEQSKIESRYPQEIERFTDNINKLLEQERNQKTRYRNALGDLAHSLKTPLAVIQAGLASNSENKDDSLQEQLSQMNSIVEYQLQRAATAGSTDIGQSVDVSSLCERLVASLHKVYRDKQIETRISIDTALRFRGDEGDLMEIMGNLVDNAFKWAANTVEITAESIDNRLCLRISDDGSGIKHEKVEELMQRGKRADQTTVGHGIGLSIVKNIVQAYDGSLDITTSQSGGAVVTVII